jgi:hypothetical protein
MLTESSRKYHITADQFFFLGLAAFRSVNIQELIEGPFITNERKTNAERSSQSRLGRSGINGKVLGENSIFGVAIKASL